MTPLPVRPVRAFLAAATDPRALNWRAMTALLVTYLALDLLTVGVSGAALAATVAAFALQWGLLWMADRAVLARPWPRRHPMLATVCTLVLVIVVGAITSSALAAPHDLATPLGRFALTLVVAALYVVLIDYRTDVARERSTQEALHAARDAGQAALLAQRSRVVDTLLSAIDSAVAQVPVSAADASTRVRRLAREQIRPLSHELMSSMPPTVLLRSVPARAAAWRQVLDSVLSVSLVPPLLTALVVTIVFISRTVDVVSGPSASTAAGSVNVSVDVGSVLWSWAGLALIFGVTYSVAWVLRRATASVLPRLSLGRRVAVAAAVPLVIAMAIEVAVQLAYLTPLVSDPLKVGFFQRIILATPIVAVALAVVITRTVLALIAVSREQEAAITEEARWEVARINDTLRQERRFYAAQAHGALQSAASAAAARLEQSGGDQSIDDAWLDMSEDLRRTIQAMSDGPDEGRDLPEAVANLARAWAGVCAIELDVDADSAAALEGDWVAAASAVEIVTEAIGNATMHGSATRVEVIARLSGPDELRIEVVNDGAPVPEGPGDGLGTQMLEDVTIEWGRFNADADVRLWARIPLAAYSRF